jgi:hypothetical protein
LASVLNSAFMQSPSPTIKEITMTTEIKLTDTQRQVLDHAADQPDGLITWFPDGVKGGARLKVIAGLFNKALITSNGGQEWFVAAEGYDALGRARPTPATTHPDPEIEAAVSTAEATWAQERTETKPRTRENSKQAEVIRMLQRTEGATVHQICDATGWQAHTVRGTFAGAFKKKLGLTIISDKTQGGERVYRID